ncbi:hypothetical protein K469DRAFT_698420 [Zopfia rhizophila CBS 207.26]|uniref:Uncharacterized protein n=1 Tax=Zopfia rhizophila CBS 207.26 TaxID=1314779 RepID=A0A6A6DDQ1_9PEZI|nr:hypothetical protein K469DRAFT_698420 [Zopfia rhizophila CBS 207.26]
MRLPNLFHILLLLAPLSLPIAMQSLFSYRHGRTCVGWWHKNRVSFLNQDVVKVNNACLALLRHADEKCLIFPVLDHALACQATIVDLAPEAAGHVRIRAADFLLDESLVTVARGDVPGTSQNTYDTALRRFYLVFFPAQVNASAMVFGG